MKENILVRIASLLSVFFVSVHITGDILYGFEKGGTSNLIALPVFAIWLYAALVLTESKWGHIIIIVMSLLALAIPIVHMKGPGIGNGIADSIGGFLFVWSTIALGITPILSIILSIRGLLKQKQLT
jgi:hypothetical protein